MAKSRTLIISVTLPLNAINVQSTEAQESFIFLKLQHTLTHPACYLAHILMYVYILLYKYVYIYTYIYIV